MNKHFKMILLQVIFLIGIIIVLYLMYPKASINVEGTLVKFKAMNAQVIIISENPDFSNPRYLDLYNKSVSFSLKPGNYYWKATNNYIKGITKEFTINSEVGMKVETDENGSKIVNIGNVILNVSKDQNGKLVGHIILDPEEERKIENSGVYTGRQA